MQEDNSNIVSLAKKRICILGCHSGQVDEGMGNVAYYLHYNLRLASGVDVTLLDIRTIWTKSFWAKILAPKLDLIHYIGAPTIWGMGFAKILQKLTRSKLVISASGPVLPSFFRHIAWLFQPDVAIVQSDKSEILFKHTNYDTVFIPNGVDTQKFAPADSLKKKMLRKEYDFGEDDFIVLHIGSITKRRNVTSLLELKNEKVLLVVTKNKSYIEEKIYEQILKEGRNVIIWEKYFPNIQDIFALSDVYVFPSFVDRENTKLSAIDIPLTVLEAMSCNLPVITTRFGGLGRVLEDGEGLFFVKDESEIGKLVNEIRKGGMRIRTREKILNSGLSWKDVSLAVSNVYKHLDVRKD